jgi:hypothetical protein
VVRYAKDGGINATNLAELAVMQHNLKATCRCGHSTVIDGIALWWFFEQKGRNQSLSRVGRYLYCKPCHDRLLERVRWPKVVPTQEPGSMCGLPCPGQQVWKQLVRRYRT